MDPRILVWSINVYVLQTIANLSQIIRAWEIESHHSVATLRGCLAAKRSKNFQFTASLYGSALIRERFESDHIFEFQFTGADLKFQFTTDSAEFQFTMNCELSFCHTNFNLPPTVILKL